MHTIRLCFIRLSFTRTGEVHRRLTSDVEAAVHNGLVGMYVNRVSEQRT
jgi:hypothetical protein